MIRTLITLILLGSSFSALDAQIRIALKPSRSTFILHEPLEISLQLTNLSGRPIFLRDSPDAPWLSFSVENVDTKRIASSVRSRPAEDPLLLENGQTLEHTIDLRNYHFVETRGIHQIVALVYVAEFEKMFSSNRQFITISEGRKVWAQTSGVPGRGEVREFSLLNCQIDNVDRLYLRVKNPDTGSVLVTRPIGPVMGFGEPEADVDTESRLHVLTLIGPNTYVHYLFDADGRQLDRVVYRSAATRPSLRRTAAGQISVAGGFADIPKAQPAAAATKAPARLSDRPPGMPKS